MSDPACGERELGDGGDPLPYPDDPVRLLTFLRIYERIGPMVREHERDQEDTDV